MSQNNNINRLLSSTFLLLLTFVFSGCVSTEKSEEELECRPQSTQECSAEEEEDGEGRGYDPCLVNKNLPVCKT